MNSENGQRQLSLAQIVQNSRQEPFIKEKAQSENLSSR